MQAFYPLSTDKVWHRGKTGNTYRLDGFDKCIRICERLKQDDRYSIFNTSVEKDENAAKNLILSIHSQNLLTALETGHPEEIANGAGVLWQSTAYDYALESAIVSQLVIDSAMKDGNALAIVGGGHHCEIDRPLGFCLVNTMAISATHASKLYKSRVAIIDLDVHYSNGCFDILREKSDILVTSIWGKKIEKWKYFNSKDNIWHRQVNNVDQYLQALDELITCVDKWKPDFIIYHLGIDVLQSDRMGGITGFTDQHLFTREEKILSLIKRLESKYCIFLGGGYIDYSQGEEKVLEQKKHVTDLQYQLLSLHLEKH